jgi:hypothetical protein
VTFLELTEEELMEFLFGGIRESLAKPFAEECLGHLRELEALSNRCSGVIDLRTSR